MKKYPIIYLIIGIIFLIVPTVIYLCFLVPKMSDEYNVLMASGGILTTTGLYGAEKIPDNLKGSKIYKLTAKSFTLTVVFALVCEFYMHIIGVILTFIVSFIIFSIFKGVYLNAKRRKQNAELSEEVTRNVVKALK